LPATGAALRHYQDRAPGTRHPFSLRRDQAWHESGLSIDGRKHSLEVVQVRLDLDNEQRTRLRPPRQHVDRTALAEMLERVLEHSLPAERGQSGHDLFDQGSVSRIEQSGQLHSTPPGHEWHADLQG
jgi:hypothetical protein